MNKEFWLQTERFKYTAQTSLGRLYFLYDTVLVTNPPQPVKQYFGYTLEDTARPSNIKVYAETCLPGGLECYVGLFENAHYGKTIIFYTEADKKTIKIGPLTWVGCLAHGGQTHKDTMGCLLVAQNKINDFTIQGSLKEKLREVVEAKINEGYIVRARFINLPQLS